MLNHSDVLRVSSDNTSVTLSLEHCSKSSAVSKPGLQTEYSSPSQWGHSYFDTFVYHV